MWPSTLAEKFYQAAIGYVPDRLNNSEMIAAVCNRLFPNDYPGTNLKVVRTDEGVALATRTLHEFQPRVTRWLQGKSRNLQAYVDFMDSQGDVWCPIPSDFQVCLNRIIQGRYYFTALVCAPWDLVRAAWEALERLPSATGRCSYCGDEQGCYLGNDGKRCFTCAFTTIVASYISEQKSILGPLHFKGMPIEATVCVNQVVWRHAQENARSHKQECLSEIGAGRCGICERAVEKRWNGKDFFEERAFCQQCLNRYWALQMTDYVNIVALHTVYSD